MTDFSSALISLKKGKKIQLDFWPDDYYLEMLSGRIYIRRSGRLWTPQQDQILENCWVVKEE